MGKISANHTSDTGLISRIYRKLLTLNNSKTNNFTQKWAGDLNRYFSKEDIQMAKVHMKRCSTLLIIMQMQINTIVAHHLIPIRMVTIKKTPKKQKTTRVGVDMEKLDSLYTVGGNVKWQSHCGK